MKTPSILAIFPLCILLGAGCRSIETAPPAPVPSAKEAAFLLPYLSGKVSGTDSLRSVGCDQVMFRKVTLQGEELNHPEDALLHVIFQGTPIYEEEPGVGQGKYTNDFGLKYQRVDVKDGLAIVALTGTYQSAGVCDDPRLPGVIDAALCQFASVSSVRILVNGKAFNFTDQSGMNLPAKDAICRKALYQGTEEYLKWTPPSPKVE